MKMGQLFSRCLSKPHCMYVFTIIIHIYETFSVKLGHSLLFLSLVLPFIKLQNNSPVYRLTKCLLFVEVDKGAKTSVRFVRYF